MRASGVEFGLPLLAKELIEQSARKRTYVVRALFALVLYGTVLGSLYRTIATTNSSGISLLGAGRELYLSLARLEFLGIYLFLPAMTCGVLTAEKERDTLGLLLLTKLGPWTILLEKLLSRLVPMASFILLSLPLLSIAYSLGGIEAIDIAKLMWVLAMTALQVGSFSLLCSAWFRTTAAAFLASYLIGTLAIISSGVFLEFGCRWWLIPILNGVLSPPVAEWLNPAMPVGNLGLLPFGPGILNGAELLGNDLANPSIPQQTLLDCVVMSFPLLGMSLVALLIARSILWKRAFVRPTNLLLWWFKSLDRFFHLANQNRLTRGIVLIHESFDLPANRPIRWRETTKRSLGTTRYLILMIVWYLNHLFDAASNFPLITMILVLWTVAALVIVIQSTGLIGAERSHQSLDVLLTTPIDSDEIIEQKFAGIWRMTHMLWIPFATAYLFQIGFQIGIQDPPPYLQQWSSEPIPVLRLNALFFMSLRSILAVGLYLPVLAWLGFHQGLRCRTQTQATLSTMVILLVICTVPLMISWIFMPIQLNGFLNGSRDLTFLNLLSTMLATMIRWISPVTVLTAEPWYPRNWLPLLAHFFFVGIIYLTLLSRAKKVFAKRVGRTDVFLYDAPNLSVDSLPLEDRLARIRRGRRDH
jgi:ABC-type transport system involved in multi-copper enzyme maturation permease subunit